ncbi:MAG TPA: hypothetical protein HPQ04_13630 [Rhodospirillaceae bacterium]|nr:hypothetical protein [Rhodospirillaceae bacterium]
MQPGATAKDKFNPNDGGRNSGGRDNAEQEQQKALIADSLHAAYERLTQLQQAASQALQAGDARLAKEAAQEAAQVASTIQNTVGQLPLVDFSAIAIAAQQMQQSQAASPGSATTSVSIDLPAVLDTARAGLGTAISVVDTAASIPNQQTQDRVALDGMRQQVLNAMAGLEIVAAKITDAQPAPRSGGTKRVDIKA